MKYMRVENLKGHTTAFPYSPTFEKFCKLTILANILGLWIGKFLQKKVGMAKSLDGWL